MSDDRLADGFALGEVGVEGGEEVEGDKSTFEFEGELSRRLIGVGGPDVVEESCEEECLRVVGPFGEMLEGDRSTCSARVRG